MGPQSASHDALVLECVINDRKQRRLECNLPGPLLISGQGANLEEFNNLTELWVLLPNVQERGGRSE